MTGSETTVFVYNAFGQLVAEYSTSAQASSDPTTYVTSDPLGSPRVSTGGSGGVKARHDYLPFGEELSTYGGRANHAEYRADTVRQRYTGYQRDDETKLDFAGARYYASRAGRFTSADPLMASASTVNPQTFNRYTYALNSPYRYVDPSGMEASGLDADTEAAFAQLNGLADWALAVQAQRDAQREATKKEAQQQGTAGKVSPPQTGPGNQQGQAPRINPPKEGEVQITNNVPPGDGYFLYEEGYDPVSYNGESIKGEDGKVLKEGGVTYDRVYGFGIMIHYVLVNKGFPPPDKGTVVIISELVTGTRDGKPLEPYPREIVLRQGEDGHFRGGDFVGSVNRSDPAGPRQVIEEIQTITLHVTIDGSRQDVPIRVNHVTINPNASVKIKVIDKTTYEP